MRTTRPKINRRGSRPNSGVHSMSDSTRIPPSHARRALIALFTIVAVLVPVLVVTARAVAQAPATASSHSGGEASLKIPALGGIAFSGVPGRTLLMLGLIVCGLGLVFGLVIFNQLKNLPVHASMREISELIYETCKTYLITQGKFILLLEVFIGIIIVVYFGFLQHYDASRVIIILLFSLIGIAGSYGVAWFGIRINTFANSRTAFASLKGEPYPVYAIPLKAGMSIGMLLISVELFLMLCILLFIPGDYAGPCFIGFAIGESLGAAALRIAGGIFTKIADIGSDLMKIVFNIKEDDARNPGVIADCTGDNAGDSVGPSADGFETYGVTGVALISFILLAVRAPAVQVQLLVWIFVMRVLMIVASGASYLINDVVARARYGAATQMNFEAPLTSLVWITSIVSVGLTYLASYVLVRDLGDGSLWWKLSTVITCGTLAGAIIPELVKVFTSTESSHVREIVTSAREGGASLDILSGLVAGNFSAYWLGMTVVVLMGIAYSVSTAGLDTLLGAPAGFAVGPLAFGFLGMGPVTIAVDSYGPVTDNAQSVFELSVIEQIPGIKQEIRKAHGFEVNFEIAKHLLEENDGCGNTFKATAKPVLIGTPVVGATTMVFFATLAFAFLEPYFFIGYLISIALFGLFQAVFMANAGGAWDNAKKVVEVDLKEKGTPLHAATVVGDTVGDPFKDTSSVAMNPIIKFTTLFGLLAVELAVTLTAEQGVGLSLVLAALFFAVSVVFVWRSFYAMRIRGGAPAPAETRRVGAVARGK